MSTSNSLYDAPTREIYLLENVSILGRKTELRQLLKLLNLAKTGQPKAALITGDAGIGKTALLDSFIKLVREGIYCRILDLGRMAYESPEVLYVNIIERLQAEADEILDEALVAVNEITRELDLHWERQDLVRAIALVKLQESIGGKEAVSQEQLVKAIRSQVPAVKKLKLSVNESIEKLVDLIVNPWVMVATSLLNPMGPQLQEAIRMATTLRENNFVNPSARPGFKSAFPEAESERPVKRSQLPPLVDHEMLAEAGLEAPVNPSETIIHLEAGPAAHSATSFPSANALPYESFQAPSVMPAYSNPAMRLESPPKPVKDPLIGHLLTVFNFINSTIENIDSALLLVIDEWDRIVTEPRREELKDFLGELLYQVTEQKNYHFMTVMTARTEGESYTLGGQLYNHFRTKLLLEPLNDATCRKLARACLKDSGADIDDDVHHRMFQLSKGSPFWHLKIVTYLKERAESNRLKHVDRPFFEKLGIEQPENIPELSFTRLKLAFLNDEQSLYKVIASLLKSFEEAPFSANQAIREISASQGFTDGYVFEVLRGLYQHDFIHFIEQKPEKRMPGDERLLEDRNRKTDPVYTVQSRYILTFLAEKTQTIETDISTDEKLMYLKKIIPLSVKSGELDREKTQEVLALSDAMGKPEIVEFLEDIFLEYLKDDKAVVRVTSLNNISLLDSQRAREALFKAMRDEDSMVREYAARNLAMLSQKSTDAALANRIVDMMIQSIDDESDAVRAQVYGTLSKYRWHRDMLNVFIKGMSDACESVRLTSIRNLAELNADSSTESPFVFNSFLDALSDPVVEIRRQACLGLQKFSGVEAIDAIVKMLQQDEDSGIRALAADSLSRMEDPKAFRALITALRQEASEDVKLAVVRALGKRRGWQTEEILLEALHSANPEKMPVFVWACIRSLGQVGGTERSLGMLAEIKSRLTNPIILSIIELATRQIRGRIDELRQLERQLGEATPLTVAIPSEYDQDVEIPEEELPPDALLDEPVMADGEDDPDDDIKYQAELAQVSLNPGNFPSYQRPDVELPFERR